MYRKLLLIVSFLVFSGFGAIKVGPDDNQRKFKYIVITHCEQTIAVMYKSGSDIRLIIPRFKPNMTQILAAKKKYHEQSLQIVYKCNDGIAL